MKKYVSILVAIMMVAGFVAVAAAATLEECCEECKCPIRYVECATTTAQGSSNNCFAFDYDNKNPNEGCQYTGATQGWCSGDSYAAVRNCKAIFNICCCEDQTAFVSGALISVKMTVLVNGQAGDHGVYIVDDSTQDYCVNMYPSKTAACNDDTTKTAHATWGPVDYLLANGDVSTGPRAVGDTDCEFGTQEKVVAIEGQNKIQITQQQISDKLSYWWLNVPPMVINKAVVQKCDLIQLQIELISTEGSLCQVCTCSCIIDIAKVCCDCDESTSGCIYYPYVLAGMQEEGWMTGISFVNMSYASVPAAEMEVTFTLVDSTGAVFTATKAAGSFEEVIYQSNVDDLIAWLGFSGVAPGPCYLKVSGNFSLDGYCFSLSFAQGYNFGAGVLARCCSNVAACN